MHRRGEQRHEDEDDDDGDDDNNNRGGGRRGERTRAARELWPAKNEVSGNASLRVKFTTLWRLWAELVYFCTCSRVVRCLPNYRT